MLPRQALKRELSTPDDKLKLRMGCDDLEDEETLSVTEVTIAFPEKAILVEQVFSQLQDSFVAGRLLRRVIIFTYHRSGS